MRMGNCICRGSVQPGDRFGPASPRRGKKKGGVTPEDLAAEHERAFLGLLKTGQSSVEIKDLVRARKEFDQNPFAGRIFELFSSSEAKDEINLRDYKTCVSELADEALEKKMRLAFRAYDWDGDGYISQRDLLHWLTELRVGSPRQSSKQLQQVAQKTIESHDLDGDGKLSFEEFKPLMSEFALNDHFGL